VLPAEAGLIPTRHASAAAWKSLVDEPFRVLSGPDGRALRAFDEALGGGRRFQVGSKSNRMGLRLQGDPVEVSSPPDRLSAPVAPGAIQVAGGQLIVLGVACGTMGGYPHVAQVISPDVDRLGQLRPGDSITFQMVTLEEARLADRDARTQLLLLAQRLVLIANGQ
jgi:5-oxoprolinase (ATP-hydrolysing) subunit C